MLCRPIFRRSYLRTNPVQHSQARFSCLSFDVHVLRVVEWFQRGVFVQYIQRISIDVSAAFVWKQNKGILRDIKCACVKDPIESILHTSVRVLCPFVCVFRLSVPLCAPRFARVPHTTYSLTYEATWLQWYSPEAVYCVVKPILLSFHLRVARQSS